MFLEKLIDNILDNISVPKFLLVVILAFIQSTFIVYFFEITYESVTVMVTFASAASSAFIVFGIPLLIKEKKSKSPKRRKK